MTLDAVGQDALRRLAEDTIDLLDTSVAVYEKNGDYAFGMFSSGWCQLMDVASRQLCGDVDNREALTCGCWLCHENCWHDSARAAIETGQPTDIACVGGIHLYAVPIFAGDEIVGVINIGYGDPPRDAPTLEKLAAAFGITVKELETQARAYQTRPAYIITLAKKRLHTIAALIGEIVERKQAEEALRESEERLHRLLDSTQDMVILQDLEGRYLYFNGPERYGVEGDDLLGKKPYDYLPPETAEQMMEKVRRVAASGEAMVSEQRVMWQGETLWFSDDVFPVHDDTGRIVAVGIISRNITAIKQTEDALRESEKRFHSLFETMVEGLALHEIIRDETGQAIDYRILDANPAYERHTGIPVASVVGKLATTAYGTDAPPYLKRYAEVAATGKPVTFEVYYPPLDRHFNISVFCPTLGQFATVFEDITERREMEAQIQEYANHLERMVGEKVAELERERAKIIQMDKMATIGQMATGVAHELNQPLTAIAFEASYLKEIAQRLETVLAANKDLQDSDELLKMGDGLLEDVRRCRHIIDHLRTFGRVSTGPLTPIELEQPISDSLILTTARLREHNIDLRLNLADDLPLILADSHKLEQVFLNLISNAEHAMEQKAVDQPRYPKRLKITTTTDGDMVVATVQDNGCGIPEDIKARIFDPFFTTKPRGEGTGLGLSISYGIVADYDGEITCESTVGEGTTFTLRFPVAEVKEDQ